MPAADVQLADNVAAPLPANRIAPEAHGFAIDDCAARLNGLVVGTRCAGVIGRECSGIVVRDATFDRNRNDARIIEHGWVAVTCTELFLLRT